MLMKLKIDFDIDLKTFGKLTPEEVDQFTRHLNIMLDACDGCLKILKVTKIQEVKDADQGTD